MTAKHSTKNDASVSPADIASVLPQGLAERADALVSEIAGEFAAHFRDGLLAATVQAGLRVFQELMEEDATQIAGPRGKHNPERSHRRHGTEKGTVVLGGRKIPVTRPRVRSVGGDEARLPSYEDARRTDLLSEHTLEALLAGISTRRYGAALEPVGEAVDKTARGTSKSSTSRRFIKATRQRLDQLMSQPLHDRRWLIIYIDGFRFGKHMLVAALGVTEGGDKVPLSVAEGSTENTALVRAVLADLRDRGVDASRGVLFVVDGSKALSRAISEVFGGQALIQRCRIHKQRNVLDRLPERQQEWVGRKLREAWAQEDAEAARRSLRALAKQLEHDHPGAANSLREGLEETLTVTRLGVRGSLLRTVYSTNPVESMGSIMRDNAEQVTHWQNGMMALRWAAAGMERARQNFRRVQGYRQLPQLAAALEARVAKPEVRLDTNDPTVAA